MLTLSSTQSGVGAVAALYYKPLKWYLLEKAKTTWFSLFTLEESVIETSKNCTKCSLHHLN